MKILHIITQGENGGGQKAVLDLANEFSKINYQIFIATGKREGEKDNWLTDSYDKTGTNTFEIKNLQRSIDWTFKKEIKAFLEIYNLIKKLNPDIIHLHSVKAGTVGAVAAKIAGAKVVYTIHGTVLNEPMNVFKKIFYFLSEFIAGFFRDKEIYVSNKDFEIAKKYLITNNKKGVVIYNGLDFSKFENCLNEKEAKDFIKEKIINLLTNKNILETIASIKNTEKPIIVGTIANFYTNKGLEYLIKSAGKIISFNQNILFVIIGDGDLRNHLEELIRKNCLRKNFFLLGAIPEAYKYLKAFDLFVLPSIKEGLPYAIVEAAIADRKILATKVGGVEEMKKYINMHQIESANSDVLKEEILNILNEDKKWEEYLDNNQNINKIKEVFDLYKNILKIDEIYKNLI